MEFGLLAAVAMPAVAIWTTIRMVGADGRLHADAPGATDRLLTAALVGVLVGRLSVVLGSGVRPWEHPLDILLVRGGVATVGASIGAVATLTWLYRRHLPRALDALGAPVAFGLAAWHLGCLTQGTCLGVTAPWGGRHPVEIYAAICLAALGWMALRLWPQGRPGVATAATLTGVAAVRLVTELWRLRLGPGQIWFYAVATAIGLVGLAIAHRSAGSTADR